MLDITVIIITIIKEVGNHTPTFTDRWEDDWEVAEVVEFIEFMEKWEV